MDSKSTSSDEIRWNTFFDKDGKIVNQVIWNFDGDEIPFQIDLPENGSDEEEYFVEVMADFLWKISEAASISNETAIPKSPRTQAHSSKKKSDRKS